MIGTQDRHREAGRSVFMGSMHGLANVLALVAAFFGTPMVHGRTSAWVQDFVARHYGHGLADLTAFAWFVICALLIFFIARASIGTALVFGGLAIATRFL